MERPSDLLKELTSLDKTTLQGGDEYAAYFRYLRDVFGRLIESFNARTKDDPREIKIIQGFIQKFLHTVECLRMKYLCEPEIRLRYDPTDSSFPSQIEFKELEADLLARDEQLKKLPKVEVLKQSILDYLFKHKQVPNSLLQQLGRREYFLLLQRYTQIGGLFREFTWGEFELLSAEKGVNRYLLSWGQYDVLTNRPHIYILILDERPTKTVLAKDDDLRRTFLEQVRKTSNNTSPLRVIAHDLDAEFKDLHPKVLKRINLGPLYGPYSKDDHLYTKILDEHFSPKDLVFRFTTEIIFSIGEKKTKSFLSSGELRQIFFVDQSNRETMERHVSEIHKYMLATHHVVQYLNDHHRDRLEALAMPPITFIPQTEGIHGTE